MKTQLRNINETMDFFHNREIMKSLFANDEITISIATKFNNNLRLHLQRAKVVEDTDIYDFETDLLPEELRNLCEVYEYETIKERAINSDFSSMSAGLYFHDDGSIFVTAAYSHQRTMAQIHFYIPTNKVTIL